MKYRKSSIGGLAFLLLMGGKCKERPHIENNSILTFKDSYIEIEGRNLGSGQKESADYLLFKDKDHREVLRTTDPEIMKWENSKILVKTPENIEGSYDVAVVRNFVSSSKKIHVEVSEYVSYRMNGYPVELEFDDDGTLWVSSEFSRSVHSLKEGNNELEEHIIPQPFPIFTLPSTGSSSYLSGLGEDLEIDDDGKIWFTQGGGYLYKGNGLNTSRIVEYDPVSDTSHCYILPVNNAQIFGIFLDGEEVYVSAGGQINGNFIARFKPETFIGTLSNCDEYTYAGFCSEDEVSQCFRRYDLPTLGSNPSHITKDREGFFWVSEYFGNAIAKLDPEAGSIREYRMPESSGVSVHAQLLGSGPWSLVFDGREMLVLEQYDRQIVKFDPGREEVTREYTIPKFDENHDFAHTLVQDREKNLWFSMFSVPKDKGNGYLGRLDKKGNFEMFPPLTELEIQGGASGIAIHPETGDIYFGEFWESSIGRLRKVDR